MKINFSKDKLLKAADGLQGRKIMIIGDVGLDEYVIGSVRRISPEGPVPIVEVESQDYRLGLGSNVAVNIASLGSKPILIGVVGNDQTASHFKNLLRSHDCTDEYLVTDSERPTTRKLRIMSGQHHLARVDFEKRRFLSPDVEEKVFKNVKAAIDKVEHVIIEDYAKGVLSEKLIQNITRLAHEKGKLVVVDPNRNTPVSFYNDVDYLTPNTDEAIALSELKIYDLRNASSTFEEVGKTILSKTHARGVIITRGKDGMSIFSKDLPISGKHVPTYARAVYDVTGAGDTAIATFTLSMACDQDVEKACVLANFASGVVVGKLGCVSPTIDELKAYITSSEPL